MSERDEKMEIEVYNVEAAETVLGKLLRAVPMELVGESGLRSWTFKISIQKPKEITINFGVPPYLENRASETMDKVLRGINPTKTIRTGDIHIELLDKEYYCRHCNNYAPECERRGHRHGLFYKLRVATPYTTVVVVMGVGEREGGFPFGISPGEPYRVGMSGAEYYKNAHKTGGGWFSVDLVRVPKEDSPDDYDPEKTPPKWILNEYEETKLYRCLSTHRKTLLRLLIDEDDRNAELDWGLWNDLRPLFHVYLRSLTVDLPLSAFIREEVKSWSGLFKFGKLEFWVPKLRHYGVDQYASTYYMLPLRNGQCICYSEVFGRKIAYLVTQYHTEYELIGVEQYNDHVHPRATLAAPSGDIYYVFGYLYLLFKNRLGDILFVPNNDSYQPLLEKFLTQKPNSDAFQKVQLLRGEITEGTVTGDGILTAPKEGAALYHPEHGLLELPEGEYRLRAVPYISRGHD